MADVAFVTLGVPCRHVRVRDVRVGAGVFVLSRVRGVRCGRVVVACMTFVVGARGACPDGVHVS